MVAIREWLLHHAIQKFFSFDNADFDQDSDEILEGYLESDDPVSEDGYRHNCWRLLQTWQQDREYLSSLNLHRIIAKHVRNSCREAQTSPSIQSWIELGLEASRLDGPQLANEIENAIRAAWEVRAPWRTDAVPKFTEELSLESLDKFHLGLENIIGYPPTNSDFLKLMKREHEKGEPFKDQEGREVDPKVEWNIVMGREAWNIAGAGCEPSFEIKKREIGKPLDFYVQKANEICMKNENLIEAEVAALRLWTGPMHKKYAELLRNPKKSSVHYVTTLHALNSGITKLARLWRLPSNRKVYRGYRNLSLKELKKDQFQCVGGVEKSVLATSEDFSIAVQYSEDGAFILEMDVGQVNRGADVSWLSQFPHEREILFNALSNVEFLCSPQLRFVEGRGTILVYQVCVSANVKSKTLEEFVSLRKDLHLNLVDVLTQEVRRMVYLREKGSRYDLIKRLCAECRKQCDCVVKEAGEAAVGIFNEGAPAYLTLVEDAILLQSRALEIIDQALHWFETRVVDLANLKPDRLQDWQFEALRTAFRSSLPSQVPQVITIVLEQARIENRSLFMEKSIDLGSNHTPEAAYRAAKMLTLNSNLNDLKMEVADGTAELWEQVFKHLCPGRPKLCVNGFFLAEYAVNTLQHLELRNLDIQLAAMIAPALQFHTPRALTSLGLWGSPIGCTGAESLGRAFGNLQRLQHVDLRSCNIADRGCTGISQGLAALSELEDLNLAHNHVKDDGFNMLAAAIRTSGLSRLKSVDMRRNDTRLPSLHCGSRCIIRSDIVSKLSTCGRVSCVAWSPEGDQLASGSYDNTVIIWDAETGKQISTLKGHSSAVMSVTWCPGSDQIASGSVDAKIIIWNAKTGDQVSTLKGHTNTVTSVAWRPGGDQIVSGGLGRGGSGRPGEIIIWDAKTGEKISELQGHTEAVTSVAWCSRDDQIASSYDNTIIVWDVKTSEQTSMLKGHTDIVTSIAWCPVGDKIASGSWDNSAIIWDTKTGERVWTLKGHTDVVHCVAWRLGGDQIVSGGGSPSGEIKIWDANSGDLVITLKWQETITSVAWRPRGDQIAGATADDKIILWDSKTLGGQISKLKGHTSSVQCVAWHPGGDQIASGSNDNKIIIWDAKTGDQESTLNGHTDWVSEVVWNPDGTHIASASGDKTIIIWDAKTGGQILTLRGQTEAVMSVAWHPWGHQIVSGSSDGMIIVWDTRTGQELWSFDIDIELRASKQRGHTRSVQSVAWHPLGDKIASAGEKRSQEGNCSGEVIIWNNLNVITHGMHCKLKGHTAMVTSVAWGAGGDQIASGSKDTNIIIWDAKTGEPLLVLKGHKNWVKSVAWHPGCDQIASASDDMTVVIWDAKTRDQVAVFKGHTKAVNIVAWRPMGDQIAIGSADETIITWDVKTGQQVSTFNEHTSYVKSVAWCPWGDQIASGSSSCGDGGKPSNQGESVMWDAKTGDQSTTLKCHFGAVTCVAGHTWDDQIASGSHDMTNIVWGHGATTGEQVSTLKGHSSALNSAAWCPGGDQIASGSDDTMIIIWDVKTVEQVSTLKGHSGRVTSVAWRPGGDQIASGGYGAGGDWDEPGEIIIWDAKTGDQILTLKGHTAAVTCVAWCPGGDRIASASGDKTVIIWDAKTGEQVSTLKGHTEWVTGFAWRPGGDQIVSGCGDPVFGRGENEIIIWDAKTGDQISMLKGHTEAVMSVAWRPGGYQIASGSWDKTVIIWDAKTGEQILTLKRNTSAINSVAWHPWGDQIASGSVDQTIAIWDAKTGKQVLTLKGHKDWVRDVAWNPDGTQIASASDDATIIIWDVKAVGEVSTLKGHRADDMCVAWSPGEDQITWGMSGDQAGYSTYSLGESGSTDGNVVLWDKESEADKLKLPGLPGGVPGFQVGWSESLNSVARTGSLSSAEPNMYEDPESCDTSGAVASMLQWGPLAVNAVQCAAWKNGYVDSENESVSAAIHLCSLINDECVDPDVGCQLPPLKKKKAHHRESQA